MGKMKKNYTILLVVLFFAILSVARAQDTKEPEDAAKTENKEEITKKDKKTEVKALELEEMVVIGRKTGASLSKKMEGSVTVVTEDDIIKRQKMTVLEVLREVPGVDVVQTGGPGRTASVFIRGARSEHTLVLIDGVEMNDPISPGRSYDFANLTTDNIEYIEILRGPQSPIYGSNAIGGVINIITKKGEGKPKFSITAEAGSENTYRETAGGSGGNKWVNYSVSFTHVESDGISAGSDKIRDTGGFSIGGTEINNEKDGYKNSSFSARLGLVPFENLETNFTFRYMDSESDIDDHAGSGGGDPNYKLDSEQLFFRAEPCLLLFDGRWEQKFGFSLTDQRRDYCNPADEYHYLSEEYGTVYDSKWIKFDWLHNFYITETNTLIIGFETEEEEGKYTYYSDSHSGRYEYRYPVRTARTDSCYIQDQFKLGDFFVTVGGRYDDYEQFDSKFLHRIASGYMFGKTGTTIKASWGTGFKVPSLFQLYSLWGHEDLKPEKTKGWDVGIEQRFFDNLLEIDITYFRNDFEELIDYNYWQGYINIAEAKTEGIEVSISAYPTDDLQVIATYTYTESEDKETGEQLKRRPRNKGSLNINYRFFEKVNLNLGAVYVGKRYDWVPWPTLGEVDAYTLVNIAGSYDITKYFKVFGRVENLLDEDYEEVWGYGTPGVFVSGGVTISF